MAKGQVNYEAWARNAITFIRGRGLDHEFTDWCGGWRCPIEEKTSQPKPAEALEAKELRDVE